MSAVDGGKNSLPRLTLEAVLNPTHRSQIEQPTPKGRPSRLKTFIDIIKDEEPNRDRRTWKHVIDMLRLSRAGAAWISTIPIPSSNILIGHDRFSSGPAPTLPSNASASENLALRVPISDPSLNSSSSQFTRWSSVNSTDPDDTDQPGTARRSEDGGRRLLGEALAEERQLSSREVVAAQEAAEAEEVRARESEAATGEEDRPVSMSLMDLMGGDGDEESENEEEEPEAGDGAAATVVEEMDGGIEHTCCVCMVRHRGAAFIPCGHTFCRLCSRELFVQRGACPVCNNFIVEVLHIF